MTSRSGLIALIGVIAALAAILSAFIAFGSQREDRWWQNLIWAVEHVGDEDYAVGLTAVALLEYCGAHAPNRGMQTVSENVARAMYENFLEEVVPDAEVDDDNAEPVGER